MSELTARDHAALVGLADGTLTGAARARAEARVGALPDADRLIGRQRRVSRALGGGAAPAPRVAARPSLVPRLAVATACAAVLVLIAVLAPGGGPSTVGKAAERAQLPATQPPPAAAGPVLAAAVDGVRFPAWDDEFGWRESGMRRDELDGRPSATVFYEHEGHRIAYTIVSGPALPRPDDARVIERDGLEISVYRDPAHGGHDVAVFERDGRTCVLAGHVLQLDTLLDLAAWKGGGRLRA
jgi:hypothetical protein